MVNRFASLVLTAAVLGGCMAVPPPSVPMPIESEEIRYETGPCFGFCAVYAVTVRPDGTGTFTGIRNTAVIGDRPIAVPAAAYSAFARRLAPYRPQAGEMVYQPGTNCDRSATDMPSVEVRWTPSPGAGQRLYYYFGCDRDKHAAMIEALRAAPGDLPIAALIDKR